MDDEVVGINDEQSVNGSSSHISSSKGVVGHKRTCDIDQQDGSDARDNDEHTEDDNEDNESDMNNSYCNICKDDTPGQSLLCCERCPRSFHLSCLHLEKEPDEGK